MARLVTAVETEQKFGVDESYVMPELGDLVDVRDDGSDLLVTTYYDTADLRLWRAGMVLRHRVGGPDAGWHLKASAAAGAGHEASGASTSRMEVRLPSSVTGSRTTGGHVAGSAGTPPADLLDLVRIVLAGGDVAPRAQLQTQRTRLMLLRRAHDKSTEPTEPTEPTGWAAEPAGPNEPRIQTGADRPTELITFAELAELDDDKVTVTAGTRSFSFHELELEDRAGAVGARETLAAVADRLYAAGATAPAAASKAVRALGDPADLPPLLPPLPALSPDAPAAAAVQAHLITYTQALRLQDLRVRLDADDSVHQFRVATRRLRSGLRAFRPLFVPGWEASLADDLRWLARTFAPARDAEVLLARLVERAGELPDPDAVQAVQTFLRRRLGKELAEARSAGLTVLNGSRYLTLHQQLVVAATAPATSATAERPCAEALPPLARHAFRRLVKATGKLGPSVPDSTWHAARIAAKRARYAAEACAPALGTPATKLAKRLSHVTDALGEHQDAVVAAATLSRLATSGRVPARTAYLLGILHEKERQAARTAQQSFAAEWRRARHSKHTRWLDEGTSQ